MIGEFLLCYELLSVPCGTNSILVFIIGDWDTIYNNISDGKENIISLFECIAFLSLDSLNLAFNVGNLLLEVISRFSCLLSGTKLFRKRIKLLPKLCDLVSKRHPLCV